MTQPASAPEDVGMDAARLEHIAPALQRYVDAGTYGGFSTLVMRRDRVVHAAQVGWQDREAGVPMAADSIFRIYSMTKPIVCTALMTLYEEGRFQLFEPLSRFTSFSTSLTSDTGAMAATHL